MMCDPTMSELLQAVSDWLGDFDNSAGSYERRIARNALEIVRREHALGGEAQARAGERLRMLLGREGAAAELETALATAIREGRIAYHDPRLRDHLRRWALDCLAIDQPHYIHGLKS